MDNPNMTENLEQEEKGGHWKTPLVVVLILIAVVASGFLGAISCRKNKPVEKPPLADASTSTNQLEESGDTTNQLAEIKKMVAKVSSDMKEMRETSSKLSESISSSQIEMYNTLTQMASNNTSIRAEIPGIVEKEVAKAMERFQTNPSPTMVTQYVATPTLPPITKAPVPTPVATTPTVVVDNHNTTTVTNITVRADMPNVSVEINNWNGGPGGNPPPPPQTQPVTAKPPYSLRDFWSNSQR